MFLEKTVNAASVRKRERFRDEERFRGQKNGCRGSIQRTKVIYKKITVYTEDTDRASAFFILLGAAGTEVISPGDDDLRCFHYDYVDAEVTKIASGNVTRTAVVAYFDLSKEAEHPLPDGFEAALSEAGYSDFECSEVDSSAWEDEWKKYLKPTELSRFWVIPVPGLEEKEEKEEDPAFCEGSAPRLGGLTFLSDPDFDMEHVLKSGKEIIQIVPGPAFGTGIHETTRLCIEMLTDYVREGNLVADIGTGSGILAIASRKLGAKTVIAIDNDPAALENTKINVARNGCDIQIRCGDLAENFRELPDVVVANIVIKSVIELAARSGILKRGGIYICSGILLTEKQRAVAALTQIGYRILQTKDMGEWCAVAAVRE